MAIEIGAGKQVSLADLRQETFNAAAAQITGAQSKRVLQNQQEPRTGFVPPASGAIFAVPFYKRQTWYRPLHSSSN